jgi:hypothetical protein
VLINLIVKLKIKKKTETETFELEFGTNSSSNPSVKRSFMTNLTIVILELGTVISILKWIIIPLFL